MAKRDWIFMKKAKKEIIISENRDFKGVWVSDRLYLAREFTPNEKFVLIEIHSLTKKNSRQCFATNKHFADFVGLKENTIQKMLLKFEKAGYIKRTFEYKENSKEIDRRIIKLTNKFYDSFVNESDDLPAEPEGNGLNSMCGYGEKSMVGHGEKSTGAMEKKSEISNTNNKYNNNLSNTDMKYNNENINAHNSKELGRSIHASCDVTRSEGRIPYINPDNCTQQEFHDFILAKSMMFCKKHQGNEEAANELAKIIEYFYEQYEENMGEKHPILSDRAFENITIRYLYPPELLESNDIYGFGHYKDMIDKYFKTDYGRHHMKKYGTEFSPELSLSHFMSDEIRTNLAKKAFQIPY